MSSNWTTGSGASTINSPSATAAKGLSTRESYARERPTGSRSGGPARPVVHAPIASHNLRPISLTPAFLIARTSSLAPHGAQWRGSSKCAGIIAAIGAILPPANPRTTTFDPPPAPGNNPRSLGGGGAGPSPRHGVLPPL